MRKLALTILGWFALPRRKRTQRTATVAHRPNPFPGNGGWAISTPQPWGANMVVMIPSPAGSLLTVGYRTIERRGVRFVVAIPAQRRQGTTEN